MSDDETEIPQCSLFKPCDVQMECCKDVSTQTEQDNITHMLMSLESNMIKIAKLLMRQNKKIKKLMPLQTISEFTHEINPMENEIINDVQPSISQTNVKHIVKKNNKSILFA